MSKKVLIIEDDPEISNLLDINLSDINCLVDKASNGYRGLELIERNKYDLLILDVMLPGMNGLDICKRVRAQQFYTPILMLTAKSDEFDKVLGLELGADDYVTKPFGIREFVARVKAIFRRSDEIGNNSDIQEPISKYELYVDPASKKAMLSGERLDLTKKEFELLYLLISNPGKTFTREQILTMIWGYNYSGYEHTVNTHINRLRKKIEKDVNKPEYILTTWGFGYRFVEDENEK